MAEEVVYRAPGEGRTLLVGGGDYVTMKVPGREVDDRFCLFEVSSTPGFGPPLHTHEWAELFYVVVGEYEFTRVVDGQTEIITAGPGSTVGVPPSAPHAFKNGTEGMARMLVMHAPAGLESFFEEFGVPVEKVGDQPAGWARCFRGTACTLSARLPASRGRRGEEESRSPPPAARLLRAAAPVLRRR